ncbi:MAG TPA: hypothetical protein VHA11_14440 [Bryobacteraceae bacterium]|nr:hypothetical protein [Bryobacteraceae bacterium]
MPRRFRFQGAAIGAAGRITEPFQEIIEVQAATALPEIGGHGFARSTAFRYRQILRFEEAHSEVTGSRIEDYEGRPVHCTLIKSTVDGLNVMEMVTADRIVANLVSTHWGDPEGEPSVKLVGSRFENLRIAGVPVKVHLATDIFDRFDTHKSLREAYKADPQVRSLFEDATLKHRYHEAPSVIQRWFYRPQEDDSEMPATKGITSFSLVRKLEPEGSGLECWGHVIHLPGFGTIRLAELEISRFSRHITMLQIDLGSPVKGKLMASSSEDGGTDW